MSSTLRSEAATLGRWDNLRFNLAQTLPQLTRGAFTQRPGVSSLLSQRLSDPQGIRLVRALRQKYQRDYLWLAMAGKRSLLVLDPDGVRRVLDASPDVYGPPEIKVRGMSHFQPGAVTISAGADWERRRAFNDEILGGGARVHSGAADLLLAVGRAVSGLTASRSRSVAWGNLHSAFRSMTSEVVFGAGNDAEPVLARLDVLMRRANRIVPAPDLERVSAFQEDIRERVCAPEGGGLAAAACPYLRPGDPLPVAGQVPHWLFAMKDTLAVNCGYAFALIAAHPQVQATVRHEIDGVDLSDPSAIDALTYLEGCLLDAMRLWPTTPLIVRVALRDDDLRGYPVKKGDQVIIHNGFNHRRSGVVPHPDRFQPEAWERGVWDYRLNALSNGPQACAGRELVLFLGKALLAKLFQAHPWSLANPALDVGAPIPHAFDHTALVLTRLRA